jgi:CheY-like chemotaxis protein
MLDESRRASWAILLVEDDPDTRKLLTTLLQVLGHRVTAVFTMKDGLAAFAQHSFDVLISDIGLPDGNGWQLREEAGPQAVRLAIAMTGFAQASDRNKSESAGFQHHLVKPFDPEELIRILKEFALHRPA